MKERIKNIKCENSTYAWTNATTHRYVNLLIKALNFEIMIIFVAFATGAQRSAQIKTRRYNLPAAAR